MLLVAGVKSSTNGMTGVRCEQTTAHPINLINILNWGLIFAGLCVRRRRIKEIRSFLDVFLKNLVRAVKVSQKVPR